MTKSARLHATTDPIDTLVSLGFTDLEAAAYVYLVENSPATGYRVAHEIGKPVANTYKAIESLHQKGAVIIDKSGDNRQVRAVTPKELLDQLSDAFKQRHATATEALSHLRPGDEDFGVYTLNNPNQVFSRAAKMLDDAEEVVLADLFPLSLSRLREKLEATAARGITVVARVYEPAALEGVRTVPSVRGPELIERWPGQWLNLVADGRQFLLSFLTRDAQQVSQAVWSSSPFLALVYHISLAWEITGVRVEHVLQQEDVTLDDIRHIISEFERIEPSHARRAQASTAPVIARTPVSDLLSEEGQDRAGD